MKTWYEILEVSENASKEVIEKAYRVLAKKYHPDLQTPENKTNAEIKMKEINEAYEILNDDIKKKEYDQELQNQRNMEEQKKYNDYAKSQNVSYSTNQQYNQNPQNYTPQNEYEEYQRRRAMYEEELRREQEQKRMQMQQEYENAYYNYLRSLGYRIKEGWTWEKTKTLIITIIVMIAIGVLLWVIPPTHDMIVEFYESNKIVKIFVDIIIQIIVAIFSTIGNLFSSIFNSK